MIAFALMPPLRCGKALSEHGGITPGDPLIVLQPCRMYDQMQDEGSSKHSYHLLFSNGKPPERSAAVAFKGISRVW